MKFGGYVPDWNAVESVSVALNGKGGIPARVEPQGHDRVWTYTQPGQGGGVVSLWAEA